MFPFSRKYIVCFSSLPFITYKLDTRFDIHVCMLLQVQSAPAVQAPEIKDHPKEKSIGDGITIEPVSRDREEALKREESGSPGSRDSPVTSSKLTFGYKKSTSSTTSSGPTSSSSLAPSAKKSKLQSIFSGVEDEAEEKPKKILVPIEYSDEESEQVSERKRKGSIVGGVGSSFRGGSELDGDKKLTAEDRKRLTQDLVNSIPTSKEEVFQYQLKWEQIDKVRGMITFSDYLSSLMPRLLSGEGSLSEEAKYLSRQFCIHV